MPVEIVTQCGVDGSQVIMFAIGLMVNVYLAGAVITDLTEAERVAAEAAKAAK